jgi:hypothetical protein
MSRRENHFFEFGEAPNGERYRGWVGWILFGSRKNPKPEKCLKMPPNSTRQVHALLGAV